MAQKDKRSESSQTDSKADQAHGTGQIAGQAESGLGEELGDLDLENLDLSVEAVDERISPSETNVFDK